MSERLKNRATQQAESDKASDQSVVNFPLIGGLDEQWDGIWRFVYRTEGLRQSIYVEVSSGFISRMPRAWDAWEGEPFDEFCEWMSNADSVYTKQRWDHDR